jgi:carbon-monoxide dehydrogenase medium subunit
LALGATIQTDRRTISADDFFLGMYATALEAGEIITAVHFPIPSKSAYAKFKQPASRYSLVGVFVAQTAAGARVAITGASSGVFRHAGLEAALSKHFTPEAVAHVAIDAEDLNADLHASKAYRAQLITVQTQKAVKQANG